MRDRENETQRQREKKKVLVQRNVLAYYTKAIVKKKAAVWHKD